MTNSWTAWELHQVGDAKAHILFSLADSPDLCALFEFLFDRQYEVLTGAAESSRPTTHMIMEDLRDLIKQKPPSSGKVPAPKEALRTHKARLRAHLQAYLQSDNGKRSPISVYLSQVSAYWDLQIERRSSAIKRFWEPYYRDCESVHIVYEEALFFRLAGKTRTFLRHMDVNGWTTDDLDSLRTQFDLRPDTVLEPKVAFVSAGECSAVIELIRQFERNGLPTRVTKAHKITESWRPLQKEGLIIIGNGRIAPWIRDILLGEDFTLQIAPDRIVNTSKGDHRRDEEFLPKVRGIIARKYSENVGCWITIIAANHGRFAEGCVEDLLSEERLPELFTKMNFDPDKALPKKFEMAAIVSLTGLDELERSPLRRHQVTLMDPQP